MMAETRKIAAILAADVVGFSRMASADEDRTLARLRTLRTDLIDPTVAGQNGRVFKRTGDGVLIEFRSVVEAVRCAIAVQNAMIERNVGMPTDQRIDFRVGIHLGDVVEESDGDLMGDGVNIAARLEGIAEPGAICLSEDAYRQVKGRLDLAVTDLGPTALKNIAEPVRAYSLQVGMPAQAKPATRARPRETKKRSMLVPLVAGIVVLLMAAAGAWYCLVGRPAAHLSVVVLPFANLSNDPSQDYFADGITENLTTDLSRIRNSFVIARNTAFTFKGKNVDAKEIGKELGVRYVLEGSVQRDQNRVRVNVQLIDAESGAHLWADRFEEDLGDLFKLQDQVVARLANTLRFELVNAEVSRSAHSGNPDVIDLSLRCLVVLKPPFSKDKTLAARDLCEQALKIDPNNLDALVGVANTYDIDYFMGWRSPDIDYNAKILDPIDRSLARAPDDPIAYEIKTAYLLVSGRPAEALRAAEEGHAIDPNSAVLLAERSVALSYLHRFEEARSDIQQAMRLSPRDPLFSIWRNQLADAELGLGHIDAAIDESQKAIDGGWRSWYPYMNLAAASALKGDFETARSALAEARRVNPKISIKFLTQTKPILQPAFDALRKAGLPEE
jgi:adenylate cyclase